MDFKYAAIWMGTASGTYLPSISLIGMEVIVIIVFLASLGAVVSFLMSCELNFLLKPKMERAKKNKKTKYYKGTSSYEQPFLILLSNAKLSKMSYAKPKAVVPVFVESWIIIYPDFNANFLYLVVRMVIITDLMLHD